MKNPGGSGARGMRFGAHMSIAGGVDRAVDRAVEAGCESLQIFTKSARQWAARRLADEEAERFRRKRREAGTAPAVAHASYLLNLASSDQQLWERSWESCAEELDRCRRLGLDGLVLHPGAHRGDGEEAGLQRVARGLERVLELVPDGPPVLLEGTAGQGTSLGGRLEHLRWLIDELGTDRLGVCLDTCHLHAAGYALDTAAACAATLDEIDRVIGFAHVAVVHCNGSRGAAGSRLDRHAHIGAGTIGEEGFAAFLADPRLDGLPGILETPKDPEGSWDRINLARLRALRRGDRPPPPPPDDGRPRAAGDRADRGGRQ